MLARRRPDIARFEAERAEWLQPLSEGDGTTRGEVALAAREEMAMTFGDAVFRRTRLALRAHCAQPTLGAAAGRLAGLHGWSGHRTLVEIAAVEPERDRPTRQANRVGPARAQATPAAMRAG